MKGRVRLLLYILLPALLFTHGKYGHTQDTVAVKKQKKYIISGHPILGYTPETNFMFGMGGFIFFSKKPIVTYNPAEKQSVINPFFIYTLNHQIKFTTTSELYFHRDFISLRLELSKFPDHYYGIGNFTSDENEVFTYKIFSFTGAFMRKITPVFPLQTGIIIEAGQIIMDDYIEGGLLQSDSSYLPENTQNLGVGPSLRIDQRDNIITPGKGFYLFSCFLYQPEFINEVAFHQFYFDLRKYFHLSSDKNILALQLKANMMFGETIPLYYLARLGGETRLRGIITNRYMDKKMGLTQVEFRRKLNNTFGFVLFTGTGRVWENFENFQLNHLRYNIGGGLRIVLLNNEALRFRMDYGYGTMSQWGIYVGLYEVF